MALIVYDVGLNIQDVPISDNYKKSLSFGWCLQHTIVLLQKIFWFHGRNIDIDILNQCILTAKANLLSFAIPKLNILEWHRHSSMFVLIGNIFLWLYVRMHLYMQYILWVFCVHNTTNVISFKRNFLHHAILNLRNISLLLDYNKQTCMKQFILYLESEFWI